MGTYIVILRRVERAAKDNLGVITDQYFGARIVTTTYDCCRQRGSDSFSVFFAVPMLIGQDRKPLLDYTRNRQVWLVNRS